MTVSNVNKCMYVVSVTNKKEIEWNELANKIGLIAADVKKINDKQILEYITVRLYNFEKNTYSLVYYKKDDCDKIANRILSLQNDSSKPIIENTLGKFFDQVLTDSKKNFFNKKIDFQDKDYIKKTHCFLTVDLMRLFLESTGEIHKTLESLLLVPEVPQKTALEPSSPVPASPLTVPTTPSASASPQATPKKVNSPPPSASPTPPATLKTVSSSPAPLNTNVPSPSNRVPSPSNRPPTPTRKAPPPFDPKKHENRKQLVDNAVEKQETPKRPKPHVGPPPPVRPTNLNKQS